MPRHPVSHTRAHALLPLLVASSLAATACGKPAVQPQRTAPPAAAIAALQAQVETALVPAVRIRGEASTATLADRMRELRVPAVSIAVFEDHQLIWSQAYGVADASTGAAATTATLFQAASISKPVNAMAVIDVAQRLGLSLDAPVDCMLTSWHLPRSPLTDATPVTLRQLLSHTAGTSVHGFAGYPTGAPTPTLVQLLDGVGPANSPPVRVERPPGAQLVYSGGGISITQLVLTDQLGRPYPDIVADEVLRPLGMDHSTFAQPLPADQLAHAAAGHTRDGAVLPTKRHVYPELAAAGLWTTPTDLARFFSAIGLALAGEPSPVPASVAAAMTAAVIRQGPDAHGGMGVFVDKVGGDTLFGHGGSNEGFRAEAQASLTGGYGYVIMTNADRGTELIDQVARTIAVARGWPIAPAELERTGLTTDARDRYLGTFLDDRGTALVISAAGDGLRIAPPFGEASELIPIAGDALVVRADGSRIALDAAGEVLEVGPRPGPRRAFRRLPPTTPHPLVELAAGRFDAAVAAWPVVVRPTQAADVEARLNNAGYQLLAAGDHARAIEVLRFVTVVRPASSNGFDSLGEAYAAAGDRAAAITAYQTALDLLDADAGIPAEQKAGRRTATEAGLAKLRAP